MALAGGVDRETEDNRRGTAIHAYLARAAAVGRDRALAELLDDDLAAECSGIDVAAIPPGAQREVTLAWNWRTDRARVLGIGLERDYSAAESDEFVGTADLVGRTDGGAWIDDWKTGALKVRAARSMQLRFLGFAAARVIGVDHADVGMLYLGRDGRFRSDRASFDAFDLAAIADELRELVERGEEAARAIAAGAPLRLHDGAWCEYCPALWGCPARRALIETAAAGDLAALASFDSRSHKLGGMFLAQLEAMDPSRAGTAVDRVRLLRKVLDTADAAAKDLARRLPDGLPLPGGRALREVAWSTWVKSDRAKERLAQVTEELREQGEIRRAATRQVREVADRRRE